MVQENKKPNPALWVSLYADKLYAFAIKKVFAEDLAEDLVQETFLVALQGIKNYRAESTELTWLTAILKNKIIDSFRKNKLKIEQLPEDIFFEENGHWKSRPLEIGNNPGKGLEDKELRNALENCIKKLPALWLNVFSLKYIEQCKTTFICSSLGISNANYWIIIQRSKLHLRACLEKDWL